MIITMVPTDWEMLRATPLFAPMSEPDLAFLLDGAQVSSLPDGGLLFSQGDVADRFFLVLEGRVNLFALTEGGQQTIVEFFEPGWTFAEAAIFGSARFPVNGEAIPGTRLLTMPAAPFLRHLSERRNLAFAMLSGLAYRMRQMIIEVAHLKNHSPVQRLATFLIGWAAASGEEGAVSVRLPLTKAELASRIGITPESLSRAMARLRPLGVETRGRDVLIPDLAALRRIATGQESGT